MIRPSRSSILQAEDRLPAPQPPALRAKPGQLWMAVCLPDLALAAARHSEPSFDLQSTRPAAIYELVDGRLGIMAVNEAARRAGLASGLSVSAAMALAGDLRLCERSKTAEEMYLDTLAQWAGRLTPAVSLQAGEGLLLEVRGSLKLFGGLATIRQILADELSRRGLRCRIAAAPTPLAALWSARHGGADALAHSELAGRLAALPLTVTAWSEPVQKRLYEMGVDTIGACLRLPRGGFARRAGRACLDDLDKAMGRQPDLRALYDKPKTLGWRIEFSNETSDRNDLVRALEAGIGVIAADLARSQAQVKQVRLELRYLQILPDIMHCDFVEPVHLEPQLLDPLVVRLDSRQLAGAVASMRIEAGPLLPARSETKALFDEPGAAEALPGSAAALVECLRGRFGRKGVCGLRVCADHRPELAFDRLIEELRCVASGEEAVPARECERPLWILQEPKQLSVATLHALTRSELHSRPERIESGWWDGEDVRRDYYVVTTGAGEKWWVYRDCMTREWWLHGIFG